MLTHAQAKAVYDRFGARQDRQVFYEAPAFAALVQHARLAAAHRVLEFGCGTGNFAATLLTQHLPPPALYLGLDQSTTMVQLAAARLAAFGGRGTVLLSDGSMRLPVADGAVDRVIANYVLDLLSEADIRELLAETHRVLHPDGLLCLISLSDGDTPFSQWVMWGWQQLYEQQPTRMGGCRPINLLNFLEPGRWRLRHVERLAVWGLASEVVIAAPQLASTSIDGAS